MADPHIPNLTIDSGQLHKLNALNNTNSVVTKLELSESVHKQKKNLFFNNHMEIDETNDEISGEGTITQQDDQDIIDEAMNKRFNEVDNVQDLVEEKKLIKGLSIEIDFQVDGNIEECITTITHFTMDLLKKWMKSNAIDGVWALDGKSLMKSEFENVKALTILPRIIRKKRSA